MRRLAFLAALLAACSGGSSNDGRDRTAPAAPVIERPVGPWFTSMATLAVSGTAEANATVRVRLEGSVVGETSADAAGAFSTSVPLPGSDGAVALTATAVDAAGNESPPSTAISIVVDRTAPDAPTVTAPAEGAILASATVQVAGTTEPGAAVYVTADIGEQAVTTADANGAFQAAVFVAEGGRTVTVRAIDRAGNFRDTVRAFTVDSIAPDAPAVLLPAQGATLNASDLVAGFVVASGTAEAGATVELELDGAVAGTAVATAGGSWSIATDVADGGHGLRARATDPAGNPSAYSGTVSFTLDRMPPADPVITAPGQDALLAARDLVDGKVVFTGTAEPGSTIRVTAESGLFVETVADAAGAFATALGLLDGAHSVTVRSTDAAGNFAQTPRAFTVDTVAPGRPRITAPGRGTITHEAEIAIAGTAPTDAVTVRILDGGVLAATAVATSGAFSATVSPAEGVRTYAAVAVDAAGNASTASDPLTVTVDRTPPAPPSVTAPRDGAVLNASDLVDGQVVFSGTGEAGASVVLEIDGVFASSVFADVSGHWTMNESVPTGTHVARAQVVDAAVNMSSWSASVSFTVDAVFPLKPTLTAPTGPVLTNATDLLVEGAAEPNVSIRIRLDGTVVGTAAADAVGSFSATVPLPATDGTFALTVVAVDAAQNVSPPTSPVAITVDRSPPVAPSIIAPAPGALLGAAALDGSGRVVFSGTAEAGATVEVQVDGAAVGSGVADDAGAWSVAATVSDGARAARANATDRAGNASALSASISFTVDTTAPAAPAIAAPAQGATVGAPALFAGKVRFSGTAEAGATVEVLLDGATTAAGSATASGTGVWSADVAVADGARSARARAKDAAGNVSGLSPDVTFTVDTVAPAAPVVTFPQPNATVIATQLVSGQVVFQGTAEAGATVDVRVDGASKGTGTGPAWSVAVTLASGPHSVRATATDAAGNASVLSDPVAFTVDTTRLATALPPGGSVPVTAWGQTVDVLATDASGLGSLFPRQANSWTLASDFSLAAGFGLQYANALVLYTGTPTSTSHQSLVDDLLAGAFDAFSGGAPQAAAEAVALTPVFGAADGVVTAAATGALAPDVPPISGGSSGYLNGTSDSRLSRTLTLVAGRTYTLSWSHQALLQPSALAGGSAAPFAPSYRVVLRDPSSGDVLQELFASSSSVALEARAVSLAGPGTVVLSFELRSGAPGYAELDDVSLSDANGPFALPNGDFESGLAGWQASAGAESQNVRSGARTVGIGASALRVTRTFYAPPASPWGRMVDVFENTGTTDVSTTAVYVTLLGGASPLAVVAESGEALIGWDAAAAVRDVGIVSGSGTASVADGDPFVFVTHPLTVPPGGKVALLHFVVQLGDAGGGLTTADVPAATASEVAAIVAGYPAIEQYRLDFEPGVRALVTNL